VNDSDDVSGTAQITNYAGVVMSYDRYSDKETKEDPRLEKCRKLVVSKNRLYGSVNTRGISLDFDERSRRIYVGEANSKDFHYQYGWTAADDGFTDIDQLEIPF
jgi:hypothetical protein